jgi:hypothetical protein
MKSAPGKNITSIVGLETYEREGSDNRRPQLITRLKKHKELEWYPFSYPDAIA